MNNPALAHGLDRTPVAAGLNPGKSEREKFFPENLA